MAVTLLFPSANIRIIPETPKESQEYLFNYLFRLEHLTLHREMFKKLKMSKKTTGNDVFVIEKVYFCTLLLTIV